MSRTGVDVTRTRTATAITVPTDSVAAAGRVVLSLRTALRPCLQSLRHVATVRHVRGPALTPPAWAPSVAPATPLPTIRIVRHRCRRWTAPRTFPNSAPGQRIKPHPPVRRAAPVMDSVPRVTIATGPVSPMSPMGESVMRPPIVYQTIARMASAVPRVTAVRLRWTARPRMPGPQVATAPLVARGPGRTANVAVRFARPRWQLTMIRHVPPRPWRWTACPISPDIALALRIKIPRHAPRHARWTVSARPGITATGLAKRTRQTAHLATRIPTVSPPTAKTGIAADLAIVAPWLATAQWVHTVKPLSVVRRPRARAPEGILPV